jgi:nucleotide-binding universal stress UspA family protein
LGGPARVSISRRGSRVCVGRGGGGIPPRGGGGLGVVMLLAMRAAGRFEEHSTPGPISSVVRGGRILFAAGGEAGPLPYPHYYAMDKYETDLERAEGVSRKFLEKQAKRMESDGVTVAGVRVGTGNPDHEIVKLAEELDAGLIMLGSRGLGGVKRALLGSVSDSVVRHAHCPVLVVRGEGGG